MTTLRWGSATDTGRVRSVNEDAALEADPVFAVADGMGGHAAGEVASQVAVEAVRANAEPTHDGLVRAVRLANQAVIDRASGQPELRGMGTTLCAIALVDGSTDGEEQVVVTNVGDSRVYYFHADEMLQITQDHSLVEDLVRQGRLSPEEAKVHPQKNILTRVLGNEPDVAVDSWEIVPYRGDRFLLCSDGLFNEVDDDSIADVLRRVREPQDVARELVRRANDHGGRDNITVVVVDVVDDDARSARASAALAGDATTANSVTRHHDDLGNLPEGGAPAPGALRTAERPAPPATGTAGAGTDHERDQRPRRLTVRVVVFVLAVLAVVAAAVGSILWFSRSTYFVGLDGDEVAIFRGRPGGVLFLDPTLAERTGLDLDDVPAARRRDIEAGREQASLDAARRYVANLEDQAASQRRSSSTSSSTTSTTEADATTTTTASP